VAKVGGKAHAWWGEPLDRHKSRLGFGQTFGKVRSGGKRRSEPATEPRELVLGVENCPFQMDWG